MARDVLSIRLGKVVLIRHISQGGDKQQRNPFRRSILPPIDRRKMIEPDWETKTDIHCSFDVYPSARVGVEGHLADCRHGDDPFDLWFEAGTAELPAWPQPREAGLAGWPGWSDSRPLPAPGRQRKRYGNLAFTLLEVLLVVAILATVAALAIPQVEKALNGASVARAIGDLRVLQIEIARHLLLKGSLPASIEETGQGELRDPWGNPYQYVNFETAKPGERRKDKFLVPINSIFDLYSSGPDGLSKPPLTAKASQDDIIVANDGAYIGLASEY